MVKVAGRVGQPWPPHPSGHLDTPFVWGTTNSIVDNQISYQLSVLSDITDRQFVEQMQRQCADLLSEARKVLQETSELVDAKLAKRIK